MIRKMVLPAAVVLALLTGCGTSAPAETSSPTPLATRARSPTASASDTVCAELGVPASLSYNAWNDFQTGSITVEQRNSDLAAAADLFRAIDASSSPGIQGAVQQVIDYIDSSSPDESGQPYDPGTDEFFNLRSGLGIACDAAGSEMVLKAHGG